MFNQSLNTLTKERNMCIQLYQRIFSLDIHRNVRFRWSDGIAVPHIPADGILKLKQHTCLPRLPISNFSSFSPKCFVIFFAFFFRFFCRSERIPKLFHSIVFCFELWNLFQQMTKKTKQNTVSVMFKKISWKNVSSGQTLEVTKHNISIEFPFFQRFGSLF